MSFVIYDLVFFGLFTLAVVLFLYARRKNLSRQGLLYLYRTKVGIKFINWTSQKFPKTLKALRYFVVASGLALMALMTYLLIQFSYFYITSPVAAKALKVPVLIPLIPYLPELFKINFLPPLYFTYWIIIIAIIAVPHEFAHGIFARLGKIKVLSTGFGFLGPFLAAFVEPDEKKTARSSKFSQLSILGAGTFANLVVAALFTLIFFLFFSIAFSPAGVNFNSYSVSLVNSSQLSLANGMPLSNLVKNASLLDSSLIELKANNKTYFSSPAIIQDSLALNQSYLAVYDASPAFLANLSSPIIEMDGVKITSPSVLADEISSRSPGDNIIIKSLDNGIEKTYNITLANENEKAFLGIGLIKQQRSGIFGFIYAQVEKIKNPFVYYTSPLGDFGTFIYDLFWWIILISLSVALVNMLPVGIFDGGRFFFLTILALTESKKFAKRAFSASTFIILALVIALMAKWLFMFF